MGTFAGTKYFSVSTEHSPSKAPLNSTRVEVKCGKAENMAINRAVELFLTIEANDGNLLTADGEPRLRYCNLDVRIKFRRRHRKKFIGRVNPVLIATQG